MAPAHWGNPLFLNTSITCFSRESQGNKMYLGSSIFTISLHTSFLIMLTEAFETPNRRLMVRKSALLPKNHNVMATRFSTVTALLITVLLLVILCLILLQMNRNVLLDIRKFISQSWLEKRDRTICSHHASFLSCIQSCLIYRLVAEQHSIKNRITLLIACSSLAFITLLFLFRRLRTILSCLLFTDEQKRNTVAEHSMPVSFLCAALLRQCLRAISAAKFTRQFGIRAARI